MSLNSALAAGASGLLANSSALAAISDNIANVNTVGYKRVDTVFKPNYKIAGGGEACEPAWKIDPCSGVIGVEK